MKLWHILVMTLLLAIASLISAQLLQNAQEQQELKYEQNHHCVRTQLDDYGLFQRSTFRCDSGEVISR